MANKKVRAKHVTVRTLRVRIKDKHAPWLAEQARAVNFVWNYVNALSLKVFERQHRFISAYDIHPYLNGATKEGLPLHSQTMQGIADEYVTRRKQFKKVKLRWRVSDPKSPRRSLGWVPFKAKAVSFKHGQLYFNGQYFKVWDSYDLSQYQLGAGSFSEDARGRWYLNVTVEVKKQPLSQGKAAAGIDLGLTDLVATSDGHKTENARFYCDLEPALAVAQRANKPERVRAIHAKIKARRKDALHKLSTALVQQYGALFVGNVSSLSQVKSGRAKSVLDAAWGMLRTQLQYKCDSAGVWYEDVNEAYSTVTCSGCKKRTGPSGLEGLRIREWTCTECGTHHDRDTNAARNILALGLERLAGGIPVL